MSIKNKQYSRFQIITVASILMIVASVGIGALFMTKNETEASPSSTSATGRPGESSESLFSFTGSGDWWQGATNKTSMALFEKEKGCFTSVEYKAGTVDVAAELVKEQDALSSDSYTITPIGTQLVTMQTQEEPHQYELHQYEITTHPGGLKVKGGQEFGYIQLSDAHVKVMGYCDEAADLNHASAALRAIEYSGNI